MSPADRARANAISFECKKDALQQRQSGDWKISFTVQSVDMDERITRAAMGTRFMAVLVEINDDETPVQQLAKEKPAEPRPTPQAPAVAKQRPTREQRFWKDLQPSTAAGIRCNEPTFRAFLNEQRGYQTQNQNDAAEAVREICNIVSRSELNYNDRSKAVWQLLDSAYLAWLEMERT
jgi:hypothetical protein